jgi:hypothetical protein
MKTILLSFVIACLAASGAGCSFFRSTPPATATVAFDYHKPDGDDIDFLSHFDIIVTGRLLDAGTVKKLKSRKAKVIYYDWLPAIYYCKNHNDWEEMIYQNRYSWTLDPEESAPNPMGERYGCMDFFYDMADNEFADVRADHIVHTVRSNNYDGVFFDWGSGWNAFKENGYDFLMKEFSKRHPDINYNDKINEFIRKLKKKGLLVMLNGGFRSDRSKLDTYADYDVVESMFTTVKCNNSYYDIFIASEGTRKVCDTWFNDAQRSVDLATRLPAEARKANPSIRFLFLNYAFPYYKPAGESVVTGGQEHRIFEKTTDRQAIFYALACSYIGNASGFTAGNDVSLDYVKDDVYLHPPGTPVSSLHKMNDSVYVKYFSRGIVVVSDSDATVRIALPQGKRRVFDLYEKRYLEGKDSELVLSLTSEVYPSGLKHSIGRIYLYDGH